MDKEKQKRLEKGKKAEKILYRKIINAGLSATLTEDLECYSTLYDLEHGDIHQAKPYGLGKPWEIDVKINWLPYDSIMNNFKGDYLALTNDEMKYFVFLHVSTARNYLKKVFRDGNLKQMPSGDWGFPFGYRGKLFGFWKAIEFSEWVNGRR
jgi:hypothetical protein